MKKVLLFFTLFLALSATVFAQNNCSKYYPMKEGATMEYTNYNKKGKIDGITHYKVKDVTTAGSTTKAILNLKISDKKGKETYTTNYSLSCEGNLVKIDYKSLFPTQMMQQYKNMEMDISGTDIELPNHLSVGQELTDANVAVNINMSGMNLKVSVDQINRKVVSQEKITTTAGTFNYIVLTQTTKSKTMGANIELDSKLWLAEGIGIIKHETYKKNGSIMSSSELTKHSK